jgi:hypothetical protein
MRGLRGQRYYWYVSPRAAERVRPEHTDSDAANPRRAGIGSSSSVRPCQSYCRPQGPRRLRTSGLRISGSGAIPLKSEARSLKPT